MPCLNHGNVVGAPPKNRNGIALNAGELGTPVSSYTHDGPSRLIVKEISVVMGETTWNWEPLKNFF